MVQTSTVLVGLDLVLQQGCPWCGGGGGGGWGAGPGGGWWLWWLLTGLFVLLLLVVAVGVGVYASRRGTGGRPPRDDDALATLRERYARGEIDDEEFESRARRLRESEP